MKFHPIPLIAIVLLLPLLSAAQQDTRYNLLLKSGIITPAANIDPQKITEFNRQSRKANGKSLAIIQFDKIPGEAEKKELAAQGIELLDYVPHNAYTVSITSDPSPDLLLTYRARAIFELTPAQKIQPELLSRLTGTAEVWVKFPKSYSFEDVQQELRNRNFNIVSDEMKDYRVIVLRIPMFRLEELASFPFVEYVDASQGEPVKLSQFWTQWGRDGIRASLLNAPLAQGGKNLSGANVTVGVGDDADPQLHIDFINRIISRAGATYAYHGTHVTGIIGGAGIRNELRRGIASKSTVVSQYFSGILLNASAYVNDHDMVITNNSYGYNVNECATFGQYNLYSSVLDQQAIDLPNLQTVFAAGNSGLKKCAPMPDSFKTVLGGYQSAKNVLSVGNASPIGSIFQTSSRGPVGDGRIKPEIIGVGAYIESTVPPPFDYYWENTGTSMSSPAIAGGMALLYENYRDLNAGANPKNGLMKALVCNSGDDWGNPGPDYTHGFGVANFWRAQNMLENTRYTSNSIPVAGPDQTISVAVPAGLAQLKVMLYWNDPAAAPVATQTLVNDLDLVVEPPSLPDVLPLILDTAYNSVKNNAHNGTDNINNIEQVVIDNPVNGNYTFRVKPTNITMGATQEYFLVYDFVPTETKLMTPAGGEAYLHGENMVIQWDSYGTPANTFTLEFSSDNGSSWSTLKNNIAANKRQYFYTVPDANEWFIVPAVNTDEALVRITRNGTGHVSTSLPFVIHDTLTVILSAVQCEGYISVDWNAIAGVTGYEIMKLSGNGMVSVATVGAGVLTYTIAGLSRDTTYWVSVRPLMGPGGSPGRRAIAVFRKPNTGTCAGTISDNDIKLDSIAVPIKYGRLNTSTALGNAIQVSVVIENLDNVATPGNITVGYKLDNNPVVTELLVNPAIAGGASLTHVFTSTIDLSAVGTYTLKTFVNQAGDPVVANDTLVKIFKQLDNPSITPIDYPTNTYVDNLDAAPVQSFTSDQVGLMGLDKFDFVNSTDQGRIRTFLNSGIANSGNRAITLDAQVVNGGNVDSLTATYNLVTFDTLTDDIRIDFRYKNHGQGNNAANKVWVRGDDTKTWLETYDLYANQNPVNGTYKLTSSIEITDVLRAGLQNFSTSFQVRWGQWGQIQAADNYGAAGYTFDDFRLYKVTDDIQMISIDTPVVNSCGLNATTPVWITIRNSSNTDIAAVPGIPVRYRVNGGGWVTENVPGLAANTSTQYQFTGTTNMSAYGTYLVETQVVYPSDTYDVNDTASVSLTNTPIISVTDATPHLQNFESGNGYWYTTGAGSSWQYGTPTSYKINRAASGIKAWKTSSAGNYNDNETSYLNSPCYDISTMTSPTLSFSLALDLEDCGAGLCDGVYAEYSNDGKTWARLGAFGQGTNWYNKSYTSNNLWSVQNYHRWHVATIPLSVIPIATAQLTQLRFRFVLTADPLSTREGVGIDDIHIYNNPNGIYTGTGTSPVVTQGTVNGSNWIDFIEGGTSQLIASVNPNGTDLGSTDVQSYVFTGSVRVNSDQYYHNRNITVKPTTINLPDSASVRFYFLDTETESLINATGCSYCTKPTMAYQLGVTKFSHADDSKENGTLSDNSGGSYLYINSAKTKIIPFDKGYYAEFKVKDFSEFWLNNGGINTNTPLPLKLLDFTARKKTDNNVLLEWKTSQEVNVNRFEVELARGNADYQANRFSTIGIVYSHGISTSDQNYDLMDRETNKSDVRYYRLKMIDNDGQFTYSPVRPVVFTNDLQWQVYPNPSAGQFFFVYQQADGETMQLKLFDMAGRVVKNYNPVSTGFLQKQLIDISARNFPAGLYLLEAGTGDKKQFFRLLKQ